MKCDYCNNHAKESLILDQNSFFSRGKRICLTCLKEKLNKLGETQHE